MWNPFLTDEERAAIRRGGERMRERDPHGYWFAKAFIWFCAFSCPVWLIVLLWWEYYGMAAVLAAGWSVIYIACARFAAWDIRRTP